MSDLRESGAIEQDADKVIMLLREDYYGDNSSVAHKYTNKAQILVNKHRNGKTGKVELRFDGPLMTFNETFMEGVK